MQNHAAASHPRAFGTLLQGEPETLADWTAQLESRRLGFQIAVIVLGAGLYGAAMGWWRDPWQALYVAIKFPLILLLTALGNALLNAMLAPLLGLNISFRQSLLAILMSFAVIAAILGAFAPLAAFLVWNAPPMTPDVKSTATYGFIKLVHVAVIAFAGIAGNARLFQLLTRLAGRERIAQRVLFAWLAVNLFLGSQLTWIARPFIGAPQLPAAFLRDKAFEGNFYENVFHTVQRLIYPTRRAAVPAAALEVGGIPSKPSPPAPVRGEASSGFFEHCLQVTLLRLGQPRADACGSRADMRVTPSDCYD